MAATKTSTAKNGKSTKTAAEAAEAKASEQDNTQAQVAENTTAETGSTVEPAPSQPGPGSDEQSPAAGGGDNGDTQDPQAKPEDDAGKEKDTPPPAQESAKRIAVKSMTPSFRRAGFEFSRTERILDVRRLTDAQLQAIQDEPRLAVRPVGQED
jgi:FluMu-like protein